MKTTIYINLILSVFLIISCEKEIPEEAINCIDKFCLNELKQTDDNSVVQLLRYYELDKELSKI